MTDDVLAQLRAAILRGEYAPRQRLIEADLADRYGASRFVLRNALTQLAGEGLVELQPHRGARVRELTVGEAIEITEIRRAVEAMLAARAAENMTDAASAELAQLGEDMSAAVSSGDILRYSELNATLHGRVRELAAHTTGTRIVEQYSAQMVRHQFRLALVPGRPATSLPQHLEIVEALRARDPERAQAAMHAHLSSVLSVLTALGGAPEAAPH